MARASKRKQIERAPRGTNIIFNAIMETISNQPQKWQKLAGTAAIQKAMNELSGWSDYQDPKEQKATTTRRSSQKASSGTARRSVRQTSSNISSSNASGNTTGTTRRRGRPSRSETTQASTPEVSASSSANGLAHPEQPAQ